MVICFNSRQLLFSCDMKLRGLVSSFLLLMMSGSAPSETRGKAVAAHLHDGGKFQKSDPLIKLEAKWVSRRILLHTILAA